MQVIQHFNIQISKQLFHHPRYGVIQNHWKLRADDAVSFGFSPILVYSLDFEGAGRAFVMLSAPDAPLDPIRFLEKAWSSWGVDGRLSGLPDLLKVHPRIKNEFPFHAAALTTMGVSWIVGDGKDRKFTSRLNVGDRAAQYLIHFTEIRHDGRVAPNFRTLDEANEYLLRNNQKVWRQELDARYMAMMHAVDPDRQARLPDEADVERQLALIQGALSPVLVDAFSIGQGTIPRVAHVDVAIDEDGGRFSFTDADKREVGLFDRISSRGVQRYAASRFADKQRLDDEGDEDMFDEECTGEYVSSRESPLANHPAVEEDLVPLLKSSTISDAKLASAAGVAPQELRWLRSGRDGVPDASVWALAGLFDLSWSAERDGFFPESPLIVVAKSKKASVDAYVSLTGGGDVSFSCEVLPDHGPEDPEFRIAVFHDCGFMRGCHVLLVERDAPTASLLDRRKGLLCNFQEPARITQGFYWDLLSYCRFSMSNAAVVDAEVLWTKHADELAALEEERDRI